MKCVNAEDGKLEYSLMDLSGPDLVSVECRMLLINQSSPELSFKLGE